MGNTVSACLIVKNEQSNIGQLVDVLCQCLEEVVLVDTGSTDRTLEILKEKSQKYNNLVLDHFKWIDDFSAARNYSFSKGTQEWLFFIDADDTIDGKDLSAFKNTVLDNSSVDCWILDYIYSRLPDGSPQTILGRERFMRKSCNPRWIGAIHEVVDISRMRQKCHDGLKIVHNREGKVLDRNRNIKILEKEYQKNPKDPRTAYYYGKELFDRVDPKGTEVLEKYLNLPESSRYYDDTVNALFRVGKHYLAVKKHADAIHAAERIYHADFCRKRAESYWLYGAVEMDLGNYDVAVEWFKRCLLPRPDPPRVSNMEYYTWNPHRQLAECYHKLGKLSEMLYHRNRVLEILPGDSDTIKWAESMLLVPPVEIQIGSSARKIFTVDFQDSDLVLSEASCDLPYKKDSIKTIWANKISPIPVSEIKRVLKTGGKLITSRGVHYNLSRAFEFLGTDSTGLTVWVKPNENLPTFGFASGDLDFGPYRIQIDNLKRSVINCGHRVVDKHPDYYISDQLSGGQGKVNILMISEWLPGYDYNQRGLKFADYVLASSTILRDKLRGKYPNKKIGVLVDHFEMPLLEWV